MKIKQLVIKHNDIIGSTKEAIISMAIAYNKQYELLHYQLYRKGKVYTVDYPMTINGRQCKPIKHWDIKTPSKLPYNKDSVSDTGLNQLFMGQSPYQDYVGNPKDGIYHDTSWIVPKTTYDPNIASGEDVYGWYAKVNQSGFTNIVTYEEIIREKDTNGNIICTNAYFYSKYETVITPIYDEDGVQTGETTKEVYLGVYLAKELNGVVISDAFMYDNTYETEHPQSHSITSKVNLTETRGIPAILIINDSQFGSVVYETTDTPSVGLNSTGILNYIPKIGSSVLTGHRVYADNAIIRVYSDGTCLKINPPSIVIYWEGDTEVSVPDEPYIQYLPMMYLDNGHLVQNKFDFIENWNEQFELYIKEDSYWYIDMLPFIVYTGLMYFAPMLAPYLAPEGIAFTVGASAVTYQSVAVASLFISTIGGFSGNKALQVVGLVGGLYTGFVGAVHKELIAQEVAKGMTKELAIKSANATLVKMSFGQMMKTFVSNVGLSNLVVIGNAVNGTIALTNSQTEIKSSEEIAEEEDSMSAGFSDEDDENITNYINKVMRIGEPKIL